MSVQVAQEYLVVGKQQTQVKIARLGLQQIGQVIDRQQITQALLRGLLQQFLFREDHHQRDAYKHGETCQRPA